MVAVAIYIFSLYNFDNVKVEHFAWFPCRECGQSISQRQRYAIRALWFVAEVNS